MIKLVDILTENKQTYDYGCVMLYFNFPEMSKKDENNDDDEKGTTTTSFFETSTSVMLSKVKEMFKNDYSQSILEGVEMTDIVHYAVGWGILGKIASWVYVDRQLQYIFDFRNIEIKKIFPASK